MDDKNKYNNALEKLQEALAPKDGCEISGLTRACIESIFPELKEPDDEKIKKEIIEYIKTGTYHKDWIDWLEKQSKKSVNIDIESMVSSYKQRLESQGNGSMRNNPLVNMCLTAFKHGVEEVLQELNLKEFEKPQGKSALEAIKEKPANNANKVEPKFKVGEWVVDNEEGDFLKVIKVRDNTYRLVSQEGEEFDIQQSVVEYDYHRFTINDAKDADVLYSLDSKQPFIFKHRKPNEQAKVYCGINIYGKFFVGNTKDCIITTDKYIPATKDQRDTLLKAMADAGYEWDADKKELKKIEQEPENYKRQVMSEMADLVIDYIKKKPSEWDEDDERLRKTSISFLKHYADKGYENAVECIDWLESIKDRVHSQSHWKPSEEQMDALEHFVRGIGESGHASPYDANLKLVYSLLNDLKKIVKL